MDFIQYELERLGRALWSDPRPERQAELYAAQQALAWALQPNVTMAPYDYLAIPNGAAADTDCSDRSRPQRLSESA